MAKKYTKKRQISRTKRTKRITKRKLRSRRSKNMKGGFFKLGGGAAANNDVQNVMIENLCNSTRGGGTLDETDKVAATNVKNLCDVRNTTIQNSPTNTLRGGNSSSSSLFGKVFSLVTAPMRIAFNIIGKVTGFSAESKAPLNNAIAMQHKPIISTIRTS